MTAPLAGLSVVVTRPERQAERFITLVRGQGAVPVAFPTVAIEGVSAGGGGADSAQMLRSFDWVVFTSVNAVEHGIAQLGRPAGARIAAIGRATARAVEAAGLRVDAIPVAGSDSEALLALPEFASMTGRRVMIVKGAGGRDALRAVLDARGAEVVVAEVYRRVAARPAAEAQRQLASAVASGRAVIAVTSVEVLESLLALALPSVAPRLREAPLLVPGERVASAARGLGWRGRVIVADSAEDDRMLAALLADVASGGSSAPA